jgi:hypothetical protein
MFWKKKRVSLPNKIQKIEKIEIKRRDIKHSSACGWWRERES